MSLCNKADRQLIKVMVVAVVVQAAELPSLCTHCVQYISGGNGAAAAALPFD